MTERVKLMTWQEEIKHTIGYMLTNWDLSDDSATLDDAVIAIVNRALAQLQADTVRACSDMVRSQVIHSDLTPLDPGYESALADKIMRRLLPYTDSEPNITDIKTSTLVSETPCKCRCHVGVASKHAGAEMVAAHVGPCVCERPDTFKVTNITYDYLVREAEQREAFYDESGRA